LFLAGCDQTRVKLETPSHPRWSAIPLDSVRRTGHQQFGRIENVRGVVFYSVLVRQHKDDFKVVFHGVGIFRAALLSHFSCGTLCLQARMRGIA
jgi:hypothetical protein